MTPGRTERICTPRMSTTRQHMSRTRTRAQHDAMAHAEDKHRMAEAHGEDEHIKGEHRQAVEMTPWAKVVNMCGNSRQHSDAGRANAASCAHALEDVSRQDAVWSATPGFSDFAGALSAIAPGLCSGDWTPRGSSAGGRVYLLSERSLSCMPTELKTMQWTKLSLRQDAVCQSFGRGSHARA